MTGDRHSLQRAQRCAMALASVVVLLLSPLPRAWSLTQPELQRLLMQAQSHVREGRVAEAISIYQILMRDHPDKEPVVRGLAGALRQIGHYEDAVDVYRRGDEASGTSRFVQQRVGLLKQLGRLDEALTLTLENLGARFPGRRLQDEVADLTDTPPRWELAHRELTRRFAAQASPEVGEPLIEVCLRGARFDEAIAVTRRLAGEMKDGGERLFALAGRLDRLHQPERALAVVTEIITGSPDSPYRSNARVLQTELLESLGRPAEAYDALTRLIDDEKLPGRESYAVQMRRADLLAGPLGRPDEALALYDVLLATPTLHPEYETIRLERAETQLLLGRFEGAMKDFATLGAESRQEAIREKARFLTGEILFYQGLIDSAAAVYLNQVETFPEGLLANDGLERIYLLNENFEPDGRALSDLGKVLLHERLGQIQDAVVLADSLIILYASHPIHDDLLFETSRILSGTETPLPAVRHLDALVAGYPESRLTPRALRLKGEILETRLGDRAGALAVYEDLLVRHPLSVEAAEVRPRVTELRKELS